jgi:putative cell wall-binding protein
LPSFAAIERPAGAQRRSAGGGEMIAVSKKKPGKEEDFKMPPPGILTGAKAKEEKIQRKIDAKKKNQFSKDKQLIKAISTYLKEDTPKYNKKAVDAAIKRDKNIGKKEAKAIHGLLRGRQKSDS